MTDKKQSPITHVFLFSGESQLEGELASAKQMQAQLAKTGEKVLIIGDGKHTLSTDEVKAGLAQVDGKYNLEIATHGMKDENGLRMQFLPPGMSDEQVGQKYQAMLRSYGATDAMLAAESSPELDKIVKEHEVELASAIWASAGDVFKVLPPGVQSVITTACYGQAVKSDTKYLPEGVPVFAQAQSEIPAKVADVARGTAGYMGDVAANPDPVDRYLNYMVTGLDVGKAQKELQAARKTADLPSFQEVMPSEIAIAKNKSIDLLTPVTNKTPVAISPASVDRVTDMIMRDSHNDVYFGVTDSGEPIRDASGKPSPQAFTRDNVRATVQGVADRLGQGSLDPNAPMMVYRVPDAAPRLLVQGQVATGLIGVEVDARATAKGVDLAAAYSEVASPPAAKAAEPAAALPVGVSAPAAQSTAVPSPAPEVHPAFAAARAAVCVSMQGMNDGKDARANQCSVTVPQTQVQPANSPVAASAR